jgi:hypothetical protein
MCFVRTWRVVFLPPSYVSYRGATLCVLIDVGGSGPGLFHFQHMPGWSVEKYKTFSEESQFPNRDLNP